MKLKYSLIFILFLFSPIFCLAANSDLKITEIMYDLPGTDANLEWIEICNNGTVDINIKTGRSNGWRFADADGNHTLNSPIKGTDILKANDCAILASNGDEFLKTHPNFSENLIDTVMNLRNTSDKITAPLKILDENGIILDEILYSDAWGGAGNGYSIEKINPNDPNTANNWKESAILEGTPGYMPIYANAQETAAPNPNNPIIETPTTPSTAQTETQPDQTITAPTAQNQLLPMSNSETQNNQINQTQIIQANQEQTANNQINSAVPLENKQSAEPIVAVSNQVIQNDQKIINEPIKNDNFKENDPQSIKKSSINNEYKQLTANIANPVQNNQEIKQKSSELNIIKNPDNNDKINPSDKKTKSNFTAYLLAAGIALLSVGGIIYISKIII